MAKDKKTKVSKKPKKAPVGNEIVLKETEDDVLLSPGFSSNPEDLKNEIKKESERSNMISRFLIPLFTFLLIAILTSLATWYYAKPERTAGASKEDKIQTPPEVTEEVKKEEKQEAPKATTPTTTEKKEKSYTIQEGDTLSSVANANGLTSSELASYNGITDPNSLKIGQVIKIPVK